MEFEHKVGAFDDEGLVVADKERKDWKGIVISLLVIGNIMGAIIIAIILCTPDGDVDLNRTKLELDLLLSDQYKVQHFNGSWLSDHEIVYVDQNGSIVIFDAETNRSSSMLVKTYDKTLHTMAQFKLSRNRESILFVSDQFYEFGDLKSARYALFNISSQTVEFLDDLVRSVLGPARPKPQIQWAAWGPRGPNSILFIESNDLYYIPNFAGPQQPAENYYIRLSKSGAQSEWLRNGMPDNLYRANIFSEQQDEAKVWWSRDGRYLAYLSFDDSLVDSSPIEYYDSYKYETNNYTPKIHLEKYPRAGQTNPRVSVNVVDLFAINANIPDDTPTSDISASSSSSSAAAAAAASINSEALETNEMPPPAELLKQQQQDPRLGYYVTFVSWLDAIGRDNLNELLVMWSNREQTLSYLSVCTNTNERGSIFNNRANKWTCELLYSFSQRVPPSTNAKQTILATTNLNGTRLIFFALPRPDSVIGDHYHVALLRGEERAPKYLTYGQFDIDRLISYDRESDTLYFEAKLADRAERHLYSISSIGQIAARQTRCLTCQLQDEICAFNLAHISPGSKFFVHECQGPSVPSTKLRLLAWTRTYAVPSTAASSGANNNNNSNVVSQPNGVPATAVNLTHGQQQPMSRRLEPMSAVATLGVNSNIETLIKGKQMPQEKFMRIKPNQQLPCEIIMKLYLPTEIEEEKDKRFPLLIEASELGQRNVWNKFELDWGKYLASKKQIIYAKIDCVRTKSTGGGQSGASILASSPFGSQHPRHDDSLSPIFNVKDQVEAIRYIVDNNDLFPYVDKRRIAIYGPSSSASYVALATTINDDSKAIQCAIAISPITNWRYMNSYLAEHYLGLPWLDANSLKYEQANLLKQSYEFSLRKLLIVHGTADEQVHVQHSMQFIKSLTDHHITGGVMHQMQLYPDIGHSLDQVKRHLYLTLDGFVDRCFYQKPITIKATEWKGKVRPKLY